MTLIYTNSRIGGVRLVQGVIIAVGVLMVALTLSEALVSLLLLALSAAAAWGMEIYMRRYVTSVGYDDAGWTLATLSTIGSRTMRFDPAQAWIGEAQTMSVRGAVSTHYPLRIGGDFYILDATPPQQVDIATFRRYFTSR